MFPLFLFPFYSKLHSCQLSHTKVSSCFPHCPPLSLPCTPLVTPPTPASQCTPPAALWIGLPPPLLPLVCSEPCFRLLVPPLLCSPSAVYAKPQSAVGREPRSLPVPGSPAASFFGTLRIRPAFPCFPAPRKARISTNAPPLSSAWVCSVSSACFPHQPRAFCIRPNNWAKALAAACSHHHTTSNEDITVISDSPPQTPTSSTATPPQPSVSEDPFSNPTEKMMKYKKRKTTRAVPAEPDCGSHGSLPLRGANKISSVKLWEEVISTAVP
ncbi:hypothetical protein PGT21_032987 [Puccinia graminis f. sp. tritici]|uniref:Uncharacterized protein n=1 Tax=Puccinia graminis f. sp. tritici TaxID=56615 RepID=A0A5B0S569_PUCGR|nr:hypothetical protein PGT21_032987 [Puccinia graminis f. sp. tritici]KAA1132253.1 hypothetical protein PGTUg99_001814 [Puccinia graminis f. sp. tritici]